MMSKDVIWVVTGVFLFCLCVSCVTAAPAAAFSGTPTLGPAPLAVGFAESGE